MEPGAWVESAPVIIAQDTLHATIQNGELRIGSGERLRGSHVLSLGDTLTLRVKSSNYTDDMAMCCLLMNNAKYYFSAQTKSFEISDTLDGARYKYLGISVSDHTALGGPSPLWLKYNTRNTKLTGSVVKQGLIPDIKPLIDAQIRDAVPCGGGTEYFRDHDGQWWCSFFGNDNQAPFREMPAIVPIDFAPDGKIFVVK